MKSRITILIILYFLNFNSVFSQWQVINSGTSNDLVDGCFLNDSIGFIISSNGVILKTINRGNTWNINTTLSGNFTSICNVGNDTLYAGGNCIYKSYNRGNTWSLVTTLTFTLTDLGFFSSKNGLAIVPNYTYCTWNNYQNVFDDYHVYKTTNYGSSWQSSFGNIEHTSRFQFIFDSVAIITGGVRAIQYHCGGPWYNTSARTNNKGVTWFGIVQPYSGLSYFSFVDPNIGYFVQSGNSYNIYKTIDGGATLSSSYTEIYDNTIHQCKFINEHDGYLLGNNKIYVTKSDGFGWDSDYSSTDTLNLLINNPSNVLIAIGRNGLILKKHLIPSLYADSVYRVKVISDSLNFGFVNVDSLSIKPITIENTGSTPLNLSLTASNSFKISFDTINFANNLSVTLIPFQDTVVNVQFSPLLVQNYLDTLLIEADSLKPVKIPLSGIGFHGLSGTVFHDTLICVDTLRIGGDITIDTSVTVTICAGTYVKMMGNYSITVQGILKCLGDSLHNITFGVNDTISLWNGIFMMNPNYNDISIFNYCNITSKCNSTSIQIKKGYAQIDHCNISNEKNGGAINIEDSYGQCKASVTNSNLYNNRGNAINCYNCDQTFIVNNNIYNNYHGISSSSNHTITITGNNIYDNSEEGIYGFGKFLIKKNRIYNNGGGIYVQGSSPRIENNEVYNNKSISTGGITCFPNDGGAYIIQNLIFNNESIYGNGAGLELAPDNNFDLPAYVINNTICNNKVGPTSKGNNFYATTNTASGLDIKLYNNIIYGVSNANNNIDWLHFVTHDISFNCINQDSINIWGQNNVFANPMFVKPTNSIGVITNIGLYDWSLKNYSLCINTGDSLNLTYTLPSDFAGNPRIYNNRIDIGAYEYQGNYSPYINPNILVFPNPMGNELNIIMNNSNLSTITLYDITSKLLFTRQFTSTIIIDTYSFSKGFYIYEITNEDGLRFKGKVIKD